MFPSLHMLCQHRHLFYWRFEGESHNASCWHSNSCIAEPEPEPKPELRGADGRPSATSLPPLEANGLQAKMSLLDNQRAKLALHWPYMLCSLHMCVSLHMLCSLHITVFSPHVVFSPHCLVLSCWFLSTCVFFSPHAVPATAFVLLAI